MTDYSQLGNILVAVYSFCRCTPEEYERALELSTVEGFFNEVTRASSLALREFMRAPDRLILTLN